MSHLKEHEIQLLIDNKKLDQTKSLHFEGCVYCKKIYSQQKEIHSKLKKIVPEKSPIYLSEKILQKVNTFKSISYTNKAKRHDWWFIGSLIILTFVSIYFVLTGGEAEKTEGSGGIMQTLTQKINFDGILGSLSLPSFDVSILYFVVLGIVAVTFYLFFDRFIQKLIYKILQH